jgi:DNA invertase Pin-like site-specific DNA recombinase
LTLKLDGYVRVSRVGGREGDGYISPDVQRDAIGAYAAQLGGSIVEWHDDQDFSGGNTERPGFQAMLNRLEQRDTDGIVVMSIDRFARSTADGSRIVKEIVERDQVFASCHERIDPRTDEGRYMLRSFLSNAELFLDQVRTRWKTAKGRAIARGAHIGPTPTGYLKVRPIPSKPRHISSIDSAAIGGPTAPGLLVPSPTHGAAVSRLFEMGAMRIFSDVELAAWMTKQAPREGGAAWNPSEVRRWFANRTYLGEVRYGEMVNQTAHKPLTEETIWQRCQREPGEGRLMASEYLLKGLIRCAACRYAMGGHGSAYRCHRAARGCPAPSSINATVVEDYIVEMLTAHQRGLLLVQSETDDEGADAIARFEEAVLEVKKFVADTEARRLLGDAAWQEGLRVRVAEEDARRPARDKALAKDQAKQLALVSAADLNRGHVDDRHALRDLLTQMVRHVFVRRARHMAGPGDRALVVWSDDLRVIDLPSRQTGAGPFEPIRWGGDVPGAAAAGL